MWRCSNLIKRGYTSLVLLAAVIAGWATPQIASAQTGACCSVNGGTCTITLAADCATPVFQAFQGVGTLCAPTTCATACCNTTTLACRLSSVFNCNVSGGAVQPAGTVCTPDPCGAPFGACCARFTGECTLTIVFDCDDAPVQSFMGDGTTCMPLTCAVPCCNPATNACELDTIANCTAAGRSARIGSASCTPDLCSPQIGACCSVFGGGCTLTLAADCNASITQSFLGAGSVCTITSCLVACCDPETAVCFLATPANCSLSGAVVNPSGTTCSPDPCAALSGACCGVMGGGCTLKFAEGCDNTITESFRGAGTTCSPTPCMIACCNPTTSACTFTSRFNCGVSGQVPQAEGSTCTPDPCLPRTGACCNVTLSCFITTAPACTPPARQFLGNGSTCSPETCPAVAGACCQVEISRCVFTIRSNCINTGNDFRGVGTTCDPNPCAGACCDGRTFACTIESRFACTFDLTRRYLGDGTSCTPNVCPTLAGACCRETGVCELTLSPLCTNAISGTFRGTGTSCSPNICVGACCNNTTAACSLQTPASCATSGGFYFGDATTCAIDPCRGSCCDPSTAACSPTAFNACVGQYTPGGSCEFNSCPGACCDNAGACSFISPQNCAGSWRAGACVPIPCPAAICRDLTIDTSTACVARTLTPSQIDNGSHAGAAPCALTYALDDAGPFPIGNTVVTLTVTDCNGRTSTCEATITVLGTDCNRDGIPDICQCLWDTGPVTPGRTNLEGQLSHLGGGLYGEAGGGSKVADDFYLCPGQMHRIFDFQGFMLTNLIPPLRKARLELFEDCDGRPSGTPIRTFESIIWTELAGPDAHGFYLVRYDFDFCDIDAEDGGPLWLKGGSTYWWSLMGLGTCPEGTDLSSWAVAPGPDGRIAGSRPVKADGLGAYAQCYPTEFDAWQPLDECCIGCVNMAYSIHGESCPIIWDNGAAITGPSASGIRSENLSPTQRWRGADDFVAKPCEDLDICLIDAWVWSSCNPVQGFVEIYRNDCREPGEVFATLVNPIVIPTDETAIIDGAPRQGYILRFCGLDLTLPGNQTWWLSAGANRTGSQNARTYFAYGERCETVCRRSGLASQQAVPPLPFRWTDVGPNLAFRIAARPQAIEPTPDITTDPVVMRCEADINGDGERTLQDIFDYLTAYFAGCP